MQQMWIIFPISLTPWQPAGGLFVAPIPLTLISSQHVSSGCLTSCNIVWAVLSW